VRKFGLQLSDGPLFLAQRKYRVGPHQLNPGGGQFFFRRVRNLFESVGYIKFRSYAANWLLIFL
jgi:hypothetical protein